MNSYYTKFHKEKTHKVSQSAIVHFDISIMDAIILLGNGNLIFLPEKRVNKGKKTFWAI